MYLYKYIYINILPIIYWVIVYQNFGLLFRSNNNKVQQFYFHRKFVSLPFTTILILVSFSAPIVPIVISQASYFYVAYFYEPSI